MKRKFVLLIALVSLLSAAATTTQAQTYCTLQYRIRRGDTLASIARFYGTTFSYLASINGLSNPNRIFAGQVICVQVSNQPPQTTYTVQRGDWLSRIAQRFGVNLGDLIQINHIANPNLIFPGQVLLIVMANSLSLSPMQPAVPAANTGSMNQPAPYTPPTSPGQVYVPPPAATQEVSP